MFRELLQEVVDGVDGGVAALIMDQEGIAIDDYTRQAWEYDIESVGMEFSLLVKNATNAISMLNAGSTDELIIRSDKLTTLVRMITPDYFVAVTLKPTAMLGRARYLLRVRAPKLRDELS
ncbi:MAG: hypothetical protein R3A47_05060 [Polyangiales bacterium]